MPQRLLTFTQLKIRRIIAHSVLEKDYDAGHSAFELSDEPIIINDEMQATLLQRLEAVMGRRRGGFYLDVSHTGDGTFFNYAINAMATTEEQFVNQSKEIAQLLARSQRRNTIPDSYLLVIDAYDNSSMNQPVFIVVKAEPHKAFRRAENGIELIDNLFLSPGQALYKVGVLYRDEKHSGEASYPNDLYSAFVYDQQAESSDLSKYFYETFLGFTVSRNSALQCKDFFRRTTEFIKLNIASGSMKAKIHQALRHEFAKESLVIKPQEFAVENFPEGQLRTLYVTDVANKCNPTIHKDLSLVVNLLKKITYKVGDVNISADSGDYANGVTIIENAEQLAELEFKYGYTIIVVKGRVQNAE